MHIQIFLVVLLLALGTAKKEEDFADRALLRQLLRETEQQEKADSARSFYPDNSQKESRNYDKQSPLKYLDGDDSSSSDEDSDSGDKDSNKNKQDYEKYLKHLEQFKSDYEKGTHESQMGLGKDSKSSDGELLKQFAKALGFGKKDSNDRRHHEDEDIADEEDSDRRRLHQDEEEDDVEYLELRATNGSGKSSAGPTITLQNRAVMNTRLRVLYTDENCSPFLAESGLLWTLQTKSVTLPANAKNVKITVEKDLFAENWRVAYTGNLSDINKCIRITGTTFSSKVKPCK